MNDKPEETTTQSKKPSREIPVPPLRDREQAKHILEALLFVLNEPLSLRRAVAVVPELDTKSAGEIMRELVREYKDAGRAYAIQEVAGGYQLKTDPQLSPWMQRALHQVKISSVSKAALETLAIIAYRQPLTKAEIEAVRGVDAGAALETLLERGFVQMVGRKETPGRPFLYGTTQEFLRHFGLKSLSALPKPELFVIEEPVDADEASDVSEETPFTPSDEAEAAGPADEAFSSQERS